MNGKPLYEQLAEIGASKPEAWESLERVTIDRETLQAALDALDAAPMAYCAPDTADKLRAALAAQPAEPVEPAASNPGTWRPCLNCRFDSTGAWAHAIGCPNDKATFKPAADPPAPAAVPLTDAQIDEIWDGTFRSEDPNRFLSFRQIITRAIERAHGIAAGDKP